MKNYWCESCNHRWQGDEYYHSCPNCSSIEIRKTMSEQEAKDKGLIGDNTTKGEF